eukprot:gnl/Chilomastix_cuspidata/879.p1 GENE.gnl/Chilomastix_cuspidata/879~~gnl/Chilomastix_cuspidata/879.p1  ORF type:complete len:743 (+),score=63.60 gnl/Chilomastix_cuspidata/879:264-2231(+)
MLNCIDKTSFKPKEYKKHGLTFRFKYFCFTRFHKKQPVQSRGLTGLQNMVFTERQTQTILQKFNAAVARCSPDNLLLAVDLTLKFLVAMKTKDTATKVYGEFMKYEPKECSTDEKYIEGFESWDVIFLDECGIIFEMLGFNTNMYKLMRRVLYWAALPLKILLLPAGTSSSVLNFADLRHDYAATNDAYKITSPPKSHLITPVTFFPLLPPSRIVDIEDCSIEFKFENYRRHRPLWNTIDEGAIYNKIDGSAKTFIRSGRDFSDFFCLHTSPHTFDPKASIPNALVKHSFLRIEAVRRKHRISSLNYPGARFDVRIRSPQDPIIAYYTTKIAIENEHPCTCEYMKDFPSNISSLTVSHIGKLCELRATRALLGAQVAVKKGKGLDPASFVSLRSVLEHLKDIHRTKFVANDGILDNIFICAIQAIDPIIDLRLDSERTPTVFYKPEREKILWELLSARSMILPFHSNAGTDVYLPVLFRTDGSRGVPENWNTVPMGFEIRVLSIQVKFSSVGKTQLTKLNMDTPFDESMVIPLLFSFTDHWQGEDLPTGSEYSIHVCMPQFFSIPPSQFLETPTEIVVHVHERGTDLKKELRKVFRSNIRFQFRKNKKEGLTETQVEIKGHVFNLGDFENGLREILRFLLEEGFLKVNPIFKHFH